MQKLIHRHTPDELGLPSALWSPPAVRNRGELRWMIVDGAVNTPTLIRFLERLIRKARRKIFLILDRLRVYRARLVQDWLAGHSCRPIVRPSTRTRK